MPIIGGIAAIFAADFVHNSVNVTILCCMSTSTIAVLNPIATIYFVPAYRKAIIAWIPLVSRPKGPSTTKVTVATLTDAGATMASRRNTHT